MLIYSATARFKSMTFFKEIIDAITDLKVVPLPADLMAHATRKMADAGESLDYCMELTHIHSLIFPSAITFEILGRSLKYS